MSVPTVTMQDLAHHCKVEEAALEKEVTSNCFYKISRCLPEWELLAPKLNITQADIDDIIKENPGSGEKQRLGFLKKWKQKMGIMATWQALMEALLGIEKADNAKKVCEVLKSICTAEDSNGDLSESAEVPAPPPAASPSPAQREFFCREHGGEKAALYCETCDKLICTGCALRWGNHHDHDYERLNDAAEKHRLEMTASLVPMKKRLTGNKEALKRLEGRGEELADQKKGIEEELHKVFQEYHETLDAIQRELIEQLCQSTQKELEKLAEPKHQLETTINRLNECLAIMKENLETESHEEVLTNKTKVAEQVDKLLSMPPPDQLEPMAEVTLSHHNVNLSAYCHEYINLGLPESLEKQFSSLGDTSEKQPAEPDISELEKIDAGSAEVQEEMPVAGAGSAEVQDEIPVAEAGAVEEMPVAEAVSGEEIEPSQEPERTGAKVLQAGPETGAEGGSDHSQKVEPARPGPISQKETWEMFEIVTSPETAAIYRTSSPWDVPINQRGGEVLVSESGAEHITVLIPKGKKLRSFGKPGSGKKQFKFPSAVEVVSEGNILVADCNNHRVQLFTPKGKFIKKAGNYDSGPLQLKYPSGITFNKKNKKIYVTDSQNVLVLNSDLTLFSSFSKRSGVEGYIPCGIACDSSGNIYVPDYEGHCIEVFTEEGEFVKTFGEFGREQGQLICPSHVAVDNEDNIYISQKNHRVSKFSSTHTFLTSYSSPGNRPKEFLSPRGVAVDSRGAVYACDWVNNRVYILY